MLLGLPPGLALVAYPNSIDHGVHAVLWASWARSAHRDTRATCAQHRCSNQRELLQIEQLPAPVLVDRSLGLAGRGL